MADPTPPRRRPSGRTNTKCALCGATFSRPEHMARHIKRHTKEKPFACPICGKSFARQDVMRRHSSSHQLEPDSMSTHARACRPCATSRVRCSRMEPCKRCLDRHLTCTYPDSNNTEQLPSGSMERIGNEVEYAKVPSMDGPAPGGFGEKESHLQAPLPGTEYVRVGAPQIDGGAGLGEKNDMLRSGSWMARVDRLLEDCTPFSPIAYQQNEMADLRFNDFDGQGLGLLSINWMSPEFSDTMNWNAVLDNPGSVSESPDHAIAFVPNVEEVPPPATNSEEAAGGAQGLRDNRMKLVEAGQLQSWPSRVDEGSGSASSVGGNDSVTTRSAEGSCYVDGNGSRAPFHGQSHQYNRELSTAAAAESTRGRMSFSNGNTNSSPKTPPVTFVTNQSYNKMVLNIKVELERQQVGFEMAKIPSQQAMSRYTNVYFSQFHPTFPFIRKSSFVEDSGTNWILLIGVAAVGAKAIREADAIADSKTLVKLLGIFSNMRYFEPPSSHDEGSWNWGTNSTQTNSSHMPMLQAAILNLICALHSGNVSTVNRMLMERYQLIGACAAMHLLSQHRHPQVSIVSSVGQQTDQWLQRETEIRTGMMIWLLDAMIAHEFNVAPLMQLMDARGPLPCQDHIWEYPTPDIIAPDAPVSITLLEALELLYLEKRLPENLGEFNTILLIHAIWRRTKEITNQCQTQLTYWVPTAEAQRRSSSASSRVETWPPSSRLLSKWRNSACDCLDILHWRANGKVANSAGLEHPTILYLHISRLVLLTPINQLQILALRLASPDQVTSTIYEDAGTQVLQWAVQDCFKARLSVIHAGAILWHVRRYSTGAFLEPFAIYIATLVVWAYSNSVQSARQKNGPQTARPTRRTARPGDEHSANTLPASHTSIVQSTEMEPGDEPDPSFIHIDRPCDDEMVQTYIRLGHKMSAHMLRVGDITSATAPRKILQEGLRLITEGADKKDIDSNNGNVQGGGVTRMDESLAEAWGIETTFARVLRASVVATGH